MRPGWRPARSHLSRDGHGTDREGNQLPAPERRDEDRFPRHGASPAARGEAKVESKQGYIEIEVEFDELQPAKKNGAEYLTYVLWAVTPEGRTPTWARSFSMERRAN